MGLFGAVLQAVFPALCVGCGAPAEGLCPRCSREAQAPRFLTPPPGIDWITAPYVYEGALREVVARLKYRDRRIALGWLADALADCIRVTLLERPECPAPRAVTWPPTTRARRADRGFDQAELLARAVAARLGIPAFAALDRSPGSERSQTGRSRSERRNGYPSFIVRPSLGSKLVLDESSVLIVDDVVTSGSTIQSAAQTLRAFGFSGVCAAAIAATPLKKSRSVTDNNGSGDGTVRRSDYECENSVAARVLSDWPIESFGRKE